MALCCILVKLMDAVDKGVVVDSRYFTKGEWVALRQFYCIVPQRRGTACEAFGKAIQEHCKALQKQETSQARQQMDGFDDQAFASQLTAYNAGGDSSTYPQAPFPERDDDEAYLHDPEYFPFSPTPAIDPALTAAAPPATQQPKQRSTNKIEKKFQCPYSCTNAAGQSRFFTCKHNVDQHVREKHTLERPYKCYVCRDRCRGFNRPYTLYRHLKQAHDINVHPGKGGPSVIKTHHQRETEASAEREGEEQQIAEGINPATAVSNFEAEEVQCYPCQHMYHTREQLLGHLHGAHEVPRTPYCSCESCTLAFGSAWLLQQPGPQFDPALQFGDQAATDVDFDFGDGQVQGFGAPPSGTQNPELPSYGLVSGFEQMAGLDGQYDAFGGSAPDGGEQPAFDGDGLDFDFDLNDFDLNDFDTVFGEALANKQPDGAEHNGISEDIFTKFIADLDDQASAELLSDGVMGV